MAKKKPEKRKDDKPFRWRPFLKQVSREMLKDVRIREESPADMIAKNWLGNEGASENEIAALEIRIGERLPPSYRSFLAETNGWLNCGPFIYKLWPCSEVRWFRERNQEWIDAYVHPELPEGKLPPESPPITDDEYFDYGDQQDSCRFRTEYLQTALELSDIGDSAILLLNPKIINDAGEWEAWLFANWMPGAHRYRSFQELMQKEHESFRRLQKEQGPGKSKFGNAGQQAARRGETSKALVMLRKLAAAGDDSSAVSLSELCAYREQWEEVIVNLGRVILNLGQIPNWHDYPYHLLQLLGRAGHATAKWDAISALADAAIAAEAEREYDEHHEQVRDGYIAWFKGLHRYCKRRGRPPHEFLLVCDVPDCIDELSLAKRRKRFQAAMQDKSAERLKSNPIQYTYHRLALAKAMKLDDEMMRIFEEFPSAIFFQDALHLSRIFMRRGDAEAAWLVLRDRIQHSVGGLPEQVAPIILLIDETLRPFMTPERCEYVLSIPRGWEASKK